MARTLKNPERIESEDMNNANGNEGWTAGAACGSCAHFHRQASMDRGACHGLPPEMTSSGVIVERLVSCARPACELFRRRHEAADPAAVKADAKDVVREAMRLGMARVTGAPATATQLASRNKERRKT